MDHITDETGQIPFLKDLGIPHEVEIAFGTFEGLEPNILLAGSANSRKEIYNYTERLLSLTNFPEIIIPTHWDDFRVTYEASQEKAIESKAAPFIEDVKRILPSAKVILPKHLAPMLFESK